MADKDGILQVKLSSDLHDVVRVACQCSVFVAVISLEIRAARTDMVKQDRSEHTGKGGLYEPPHVLVTAKTMANIMVRSLDPRS
jgi:hypothetical protein